MRTPYQIVSDHYAASSRHDLDGMLADLAADAQWIEMETSAYAGTHVGREQIIAKVFAPIGAEWEGFAFTLERLIDGGNTVVALGHYSGVFRATGKAMRARVTHVWDVADGRVQRFEQFADTLALERATV
ncbi:MAG: nuclear transport factor 2 family protein [Rubrivivax sp.]|nr:nuclear transport factor 2 family protein [Rubrivivax sp.]